MTRRDDLQFVVFRGIPPGSRPLGLEGYLPDGNPPTTQPWRFRSQPRHYKWCFPGSTPSSNPAHGSQSTATWRWFPTESEEWW